jgi:hypothetical protein
MYLNNTACIGPVRIWIHELQYRYGTVSANLAPANFRNIDMQHSI